MLRLISVHWYRVAVIADIQHFYDRECISRTRPVLHMIDAYCLFMRVCRTQALTRSARRFMSPSIETRPWTCGTMLLWARVSKCTGRACMHGIRARSSSTAPAKADTSMQSINVAFIGPFALQSFGCCTNDWWWNHSIVLMGTVATFCGGLCTLLRD